MAPKKTLFIAFAAMAVLACMAAPVAAFEAAPGGHRRALGEERTFCGCTCDCSGMLCGTVETVFNNNHGEKCADPKLAAAGAKDGMKCSALELAANKAAKDMAGSLAPKFSHCSGTFSTSPGARRLATSPPPVPTVHISTKLQAIVVLALGIVICLFGYQTHSLVFAYSGYVVGYAIFVIVYLLATDAAESNYGAVTLGGWYAWGAIAAGAVFAIIGAVSTSAGLNFTGTAVGTALAGVVYAAITSGIEGNPGVVNGLTWLGCVVIAIVLLHAFTKPMLIGGTAALGAFYIVTSSMTLGWNSTLAVSSGLGVSSHAAAWIVLAVLFLLGAGVQCALSRGDEFDLHGRRRWYPTRFGYAQATKPQQRQQQRQGGAPVMESNGTQLVYGV